MATWSRCNALCIDHGIKTMSLASTIPKGPDMLQAIAGNLAYVPLSLKQQHEVHQLLIAWQTQDRLESTLGTGLSGTQPGKWLPKLK